MNDDEREAARLLEPLRQPEPAAASSVDVGRAMRTGRRTVRVRQVAGTLACVLAVLGIAFTVTVPYHSPPAKQPEDEFGATTQEFGIGSAGGFTPMTYETGRTRQRATLTAPELDDTDAVVTMYPKGRLPKINGETWKPNGDEAPDVNGGSALWPSRPALDADAVELAWQWRPGAWAFVSVTGPDANEDRAHKVAQSVEAGADIDVAVPVRVPGDLTGGMKVIGTRRSIGEAQRVDRVYEVRYGHSDTGDEWLLAGLREPVAHDGDATELDGRDALVDDTHVSFTDGTDLFVEVSTPSVLDIPLSDLAWQIELKSDFDWSPPPLSPSPTDADETSSATSSSADEPTSESSTP